MRFTATLPCLMILAAGMRAPLHAADADAPATQPTSAQASASSDDSTIDWLMSQATTQPAHPATQPANPPPSPFVASRDDGSVEATILLSDGKKIIGRFTTTPGKPLRFWDEAQKEYHDIPLDLIQSLRAKITWERQQREWRFKQSGSDIKEYSDKTYPAREMEYVATLANGQTITGGVVAPLYQQLPDGETTLYVLHKRDKGNVGQSLDQLVYVKEVIFGPPTTRPSTQNIQTSDRQAK